MNGEVIDIGGRVVTFQSSAPNLKFDDISSEERRTYVYSKDLEITIERPLRLATSKSGGHRLFDAQERSHYIQPGWKQIIWTVLPGQPNFVK